jgi:hypothetical protein
MGPISTKPKGIMHYKLDLSKLNDRCNHEAKWWTVTDSGDPDSILAEWKIHGAPLGIINDATPTGIFPPVAPADSTWDPLKDIASDPRGWTNYKSAEESPETIAEILKSMVKEKWALTCTTWAEIVSIVGSDQVTLGKLALISKQKMTGLGSTRLSGI